MTQSRSSLSSYIPYAILAVGAGLAYFASSSLIKALWMAGTALTFIGILCCLLSSFVQAKPLISPNLKLVHFSKAKQIILLLAGQSALLLISFLLFYVLEIQTQTNARLHYVESAYFVQTIQKNLFSLGLFPWLLYSVLGIGLIYLSIRYNRAPVLSRAVSWKRKRKLELFIHNMSAIITDIVVMGPFLFVTSLALIWFCEMVTVLLKLDSLFSTPFRTTFICGAIIVFLRKSNVQLIDWMNRHQSSVAKFLVAYMFAVSFFILWLHGSADWFSFGKEITDPNKVVKSALAGFFTEEALQTRIQFLIWGWWLTWAPWMASLIARTSIGFSVMQALLLSVVLPFCVFVLVLPKVTSNQWLVLYTWFKLPNVQVLVFMALMFFMVKAWGKMHNLGDVARGAMVPIGRLTKRPLKQWMHHINLGLIVYIPGWMMLGWLPMQFFVGINAIFMLLVVALFLFAWIASLRPLFWLKKHKLQQPL